MNCVEFGYLHIEAEETEDYADFAGFIAGIFYAILSSSKGIKNDQRKMVNA